MLGRGLSIYCIFSYVRIVLQMLYLKWHIFHDVRITFFCGTFALRMERMLKLRFVFVHHRDVFFHYITYLFDVLTSFYDVRITLYFGTFELRTEITF